MSTVPPSPASRSPTLPSSEMRSVPSSSRPSLPRSHTHTTGNSRPFARCTVIIRTASMRLGLERRLSLARVERRRARRRRPRSRAGRGPRRPRTRAPSASACARWPSAATPPRQRRAGDGRSPCAVTARSISVSSDTCVATRRSPSSRSTSCREPPPVALGQEHPSSSSSGSRDRPPDVAVHSPSAQPDQRHRVERQAAERRGEHRVDRELVERVGERGEPVTQIRPPAAGAKYPRPPTTCSRDAALFERPLEEAHRGGGPEQHHHVAVVRTARRA